MIDRQSTLTIAFRAFNLDVLVGRLTVQRDSLRLIVLGLLNQAQTAIALVADFAAVVADVLEFAAVAASAVCIHAFRLCRLADRIGGGGSVRLCRWLLSFNVGHTPWAGRHRTSLRLR